MLNSDLGCQLGEPGEIAVIGAESAWKLADNIHEGNAS